MKPNRVRAPKTSLKFLQKNHVIPDKDQLLKYINTSNLRNDLQLFKFDLDAKYFEKRGGAQIHDVCLLDENHHALTWIVGGEKVILRVMVHAHQYLSSPIIVFFVKNDLGQNLFVYNTYFIL